MVTSRGKDEGRREFVHTARFKMDNQQAPALGAHGTLLNAYVAAWMEGGFECRMDTRTWMAEPFTVDLKPSQPCLSALPQYEIKPLKLFKQWSTDNVTKKLTGRRISKTLWKERQWHKTHKWQALAETSNQAPLHADDSIPLVLIEVFNFMYLQWQAIYPSVKMLP